MLGQLLNSRYKIQQLLSKNTEKRTILARDSVNQELVVIKLHALPSCGLEEFKQKFKTIYNIYSSFLPNHLDYFEIEGINGKQLAIVRPYIPTSSLADLINNHHTFSENQLKQIAKYLLEILVYLQQQSPPISHDNLKPSNIFITYSSPDTIDKLYLVDFSLSNLPSGSWDLYNLGRTLTILATGKDDFDPSLKQLENEYNFSAYFLYWLKRSLSLQSAEKFTTLNEALDSLYHDQLILITSGNKIKPYGSEITLHKSEHFLQINILSKASQRVINKLQTQLKLLLPLALFSVPLLALVMINKPINLIPLSIVIWAFFINLLASWFTVKPGNIISAIEREIWMTPEEIGLSCYFLGVKLPKTQSGAIEEIQRIERRNVSFMTEMDKWPPKTLFPSLVIKTKQEEYRIDGGPNITEAELDWLAHELSNWLGLPITRI